MHQLSLVETKGGALLRLNNPVGTQAGERLQALLRLKPVRRVGVPLPQATPLRLLPVTGEPVAVLQRQAVPEAGATPPLRQEGRGEPLRLLLLQGPAGAQEHPLVQVGAHKLRQAAVLNEVAGELEGVDVAASSVEKRVTCLGNAQRLAHLVGEGKAALNVEKKVTCLVNVRKVEPEGEGKAALSAGKKAICPENVRKAALEEGEGKAALSVGKKAICPATVRKAVQRVGDQRTASSVGRKATCPANVPKEVETPALTAAKKDICRRTVLRSGNLGDEAEAVLAEGEGKLTVQEGPQAGGPLGQRQEAGAAALLRLRDKAAGAELRLPVVDSLPGALLVPVQGLMHGELLLLLPLLAVTLGVHRPRALPHLQLKLTHGGLRLVKALQLEAILGVHLLPLLPRLLVKP